jgi:hypothetical protein
VFAKEVLNGSASESEIQLLARVLQHVLLRLHLALARFTMLRDASQCFTTIFPYLSKEYIHRAQSVSRTAPAVLLRSLVCPTCQEKAGRWLPSSQIL